MLTSSPPIYGKILSRLRISLRKRRRISSIVEAVPFCSGSVVECSPHSEYERSDERLAGIGREWCWRSIEIVFEQKTYTTLATLSASLLTGPTQVAPLAAASPRLRQKLLSTHCSCKPALRRPSNRLGICNEPSFSHLIVSLGLRRRASAKADFALSIWPSRAEVGRPDLRRVRKHESPCRLTCGILR